ncbi:MAG: hypothetical protein JW726_15100 [Anaerolineales bacterium]|nr:hypothetical protein [Anaerolineales bacterium]
MSITTEIFSSAPTRGIHGEIDPDNYVIYGVSICSLAEAAGHRLLFDDTSLRQIIELGNKHPKGVKCRFAHPSITVDGMGRYLGRVKNFRFFQDKVIADLFLSAVAAQSPSGDLRKYVLALACEDPQAFGISVVVDISRVWILSTGEEVPAEGPRPKKATTTYPIARVHRLYAADCVDDPALNPGGLFQQVALTKKENLPMSESQDLYQVEAAAEEPQEEPAAQPATPETPPAAEALPSVAHAAVISELRSDISALKRAFENQVVRIGGQPPRGSSIHQSTPIETFQAAWDWLFGVSNAKTPPPDLRRADTLYRLITGDIEWHGVFRPEHAAFASATTTTLADLAANAMNKVIVELFANLAAYRWYEQIVTVQPTDGSLQDMAWIQFGGIANLPSVSEGAAYTELSVSDTRESDSFTKYGGYVGITEKMIRNSEIAKMQAVPKALAVAAIRTRSAAIAGIFTTAAGLGPTLDQDATALFDAGHSNLATTAYSWTAWKATRIECAKHAEPGSAKRLMLFPKYWLGPADLYDQALIDFGYGVGPGGRPGTGDNDVNPFAQTRPGDPRPIPLAVPEWTDTNDWAYLVDPDLFPVICMAYADNPGGGKHPAPQLYVASSPLAGLMFTNDTLPIKVRDYFAYGVATYRGIGKRNVA